MTRWIMISSSMHVSFARTGWRGTCQLHQVRPSNYDPLTFFDPRRDFHAPARAPTSSDNPALEQLSVSLHEHDVLSVVVQHGAGRHCNDFRTLARPNVCLYGRADTQFRL